MSRTPLPSGHDADFKIERKRRTFFAGLESAGIDYGVLKAALKRVGAPKPSCGGQAMRNRILQAAHAGRPLSYIVEVEGAVAMDADMDRREFEAVEPVSKPYQIKMVSAEMVAICARRKINVEGMTATQAAETLKIATRPVDNSPMYRQSDADKAEVERLMRKVGL